MATTSATQEQQINASSTIESTEINPDSSAWWQSSWWPSFKWSQATKQGCLEAEKNMLIHFLGEENYDYIQHDVCINFDASPNSAKLAHSKSCSSVFTKRNSINATTSNIITSQNDNQIVSDNTNIQSNNKKVTTQNNNNNKTESIHTVTIFPRLSKSVKNNEENKEENKDSNEEKLIKKIPPIVLNHGYGCASGIFIPGIPTLYQNIIPHLDLQNSSSDDSKDSNNNQLIPNAPAPLVVHLIDWLGCGLSSKPKFECITVEETEDFFC